MPTIKGMSRVRGGYRFFFYSDEKGEPIHVHVGKDENVAKFWIDPISLSSNKGFSAKDIIRIKEILFEHQDKIRRAWDEHFSK